jgi:hypothetical protein
LRKSVAWISPTLCTHDPEIIEELYKLRLELERLKKEERIKAGGTNA